MTQKAQFVFPSDYGEFKKAERLIDRSIVEKLPIITDITFTDKSRPDPPKKLTSVVKRRLKDQLVAPGSRKFECLCIEVEDDDGMSWSAESINEMIHNDQDLSRFTPWCFLNEKPIEQMPAIAEFIGLKTFLKLAVRHRITSGFPALKPWMTLIILAGAVVIGVAVKIVDLWLKIKEPVKGQSIGGFILDPWLFLPTTMFVGLGLVSQYLLSRQDSLSKQSRRNSFIEKYSEILKDLRPGEKISHHFDDFIESLAAQLQFGNLPRIVIIDNYGNQDFTTRKVIERYFDNYAAFGRVPECWIIFESKEGARFSNKVIERRKQWGYFRTAIYHQLFLNEEERKMLANEIGRPEAAAYARVKKICLENPHIEDRIYQLFADYRALHPVNVNQYGTLEFLYLLSLLSITPGDIPLSVNYLKSNLSAKNLLRSEVLSNFLKGTDLGVKEFQEAIEDVHNHFRSALVVDFENPYQKFRVQPEVAHVLTKNADKLNLPSPKLGHLFWALFWYDKYDKTRNEVEGAFRMRKISAHLLRSSINPLKESARHIELHKQFFEAILFSVDECLKTCLFQDISSLLDSALDLAQVKDQVESESRLRRLLKKHWEAYSVLSDEDILDSVISILTSLDIQIPDKQEAKPDVLERLFFESLPLSDARRRRLTTGWFWQGVDKATIESFYDYTRARSSWLAFIGQSFNSDLEKSLLTEAARLGEQELIELAGRVHDRIQASHEESARVTDIITLSMALHSCAISLESNINSEINKLTFSSELFDGLNSIADMWLPKVESACDLIEKVIFLAAEMKGKSNQIESGFMRRDYLVYALSRMIFVDAAIAVLVIWKNLSYFQLLQIQNPPTPQMLQIRKIYEDAQAIIALCQEQLGWQIPRNESSFDPASETSLKEIDKSIKLSEYLFQRFGLYRLSNFVGLRRAYFNFLFDDVHVDSDELAKEYVGAAIDQTDITGLMANLIVANSIRKNHELAATYLNKAASLAIKGGFGPRIKQEISLIAILNGHSYDFVMNDFLDQVLEVDATQKSLLARYLTAIPENQITIRMLAFLNVLGRDYESESAVKATAILQSVVEGIKDDDARDENLQLIDYFHLKNQLAKGESPDFTAIYEKWKDRKGSWIYPGILNQMINNGYLNDELRCDCLELLDRPAASDQYTTYYNLGVTIAAILVTNDDYDDETADLLATYLKDAIQKWEGEVSSESHIRTYELLQILDPDNESVYYSKVLEWQVKKMRRDLNRKYPDMIRQGQFFPVFREYFNIMRFYGLGLDIPESEYWNQIRIDPDQIRIRANEWKLNGAAVPIPLVRDGMSMVLSADFLCLGHYLYSPPVIMDATFDEHRAQINIVAQQYFNSLLDLIGRIPGLPKEIRNLVADFAERLPGYLELDE